MKKWGWLIGGLILALVVFSLFLPATSTMRSSQTVYCTNEAMTRWTVNPSNWKAWWPGQVVNDSTLELNGQEYQVEIVLLNGFRALRRDRMERIEFQFVPHVNDSSLLSLTRTQATGWNPFSRISKWVERRVSADYSDPLLKSLCTFFDDPTRVYGFSIKRDKVVHVSWMSAKQTFDHLPTVSEIYNLLDGLVAYIESQNGVIQADPILHVRSLDDQTMELMVAYPTDRALKPNDRYSVKSMIPGFLLVGEIRGGPHSISQAEQNLEYYMRDHKLQSPAIPFQTLITNRAKVADTTQWVTRLNYPVF